MAQNKKPLIRKRAQQAGQLNIRKLGNLCIISQMKRQEEKKIQKYWPQDKIAKAIIIGGNPLKPRSSVKN